MSAVIKTLTPFTSQILLLEALEEVGAEPQLLDSATMLRELRHRGGLQVGDILTNRRDYNGLQHFRRVGEVYQLRHDADEFNGSIISRLQDRKYRSVTDFLAQLEGAYKNAHQRLLQRLAEEERQRLEQERVARVEATRLKAIERAKAQGYSVKEHRANGKIQLVLTRTVY
ncbi:hypothetical protein [Marinobacterium aestuariivivens]|uniref:Uncharacterized protein n=1 Tax=Marinobacterium aestuariivivens TaxID=1698799 RepID=A0ABW1ZZZ6_9GAMM